MKKLEFSGVVIDLDIFRCSVLILVGKDEETIQKGLPDLYKCNEWSNNDLENTKKLIAEVFKDNDDNIWKGITIPNEVDAIVVFREKDITKVSMKTAVHELYHAMRKICESHGVEDEETEAYLLEYLFSQFLTAQDNYRKNNVNKFNIEEK